MNATVQTEATPNPNAVKFVVKQKVKNEGKVTFTSADQAQNLPMAKALFGIEGVQEVHFFDNFITVTKSAELDWQPLCEKISRVIGDMLESHNADFEVKETAPEKSEEMKKIDAILDRTIRPALQRDGGDLTLVNLTGKELSIHYEGACGCCPGATMGTLMIIRQILQEEYDPQIEVYAV